MRLFCFFNNPRDKEVKAIRGDQIEVFRILNGYENILFSLKKVSRTRRHEITLVKDQSRLHIRKYMFSRRTIN